MKIKIPIEKHDNTLNMRYCLYHPKKRATIFTGHLILARKVVFVGYCSMECSRTQHGVPVGCAGNFRRAK